MNDPREPLGNLVEEVDALAGAGEQHKRVRVRDILRRMPGSTYGPLLLLLGLFSISPATLVPGMNWLVAGITAIVALQMILGAKRPWLPRKALDTEVKTEDLRTAVKGVGPWARRLDPWLRPRLTFMTEPPFLNIAGVVCLAAAVATFPLGLIPAGPVAPGLAIAILGLALTAQDGALLLLAGAIAFGAVLLVTMVLT